MAEADALHGVRVIDFGQYIAGPLAGMLLADFGADVIRVDPPGGPRYRSAANATWNRGKRSIVLDLKQAGDLAIAQKLIASADVVLENFRPGVMDRLGLGAKALTALHPRLIYCAMPGFASDDPRAGMRGWEGVIAAATACHSSHAAVKVDSPVYCAIPYSSDFAASLAVCSIGAALLERQRSGLGQMIEVPLFNATFTAFSGKLMKVDGQPEIDGASRWTHMKCQDDIWLMYLTGRLNKTFLELAGCREGETPPAVAQQRLEALFRTRTSVAWEAFCAELGLEGISCLSGRQWLHHPMAEITSTVADFDDPVLGRFRGYTLNPRLSDTPGRVRSPRALPDADRAEILKELASAPQAATARSAAPAGTQTLQSALQGVKVLDLGIILASPSCGRTLAEFGADVIKIDSAHRNPVNWHNDVNRAKRSIVLDLKKPAGLEIFWRLVEDADVVLENFRLGVADKLGVGYEAVSRRNPRIVYASVNAFGRPGPYADRPGREVLAQAIAGMQLRLGGAKPVLNPLNANDYCTGLMCVYGVALGLLARQRTGRGQFINSALIYSATLLQTNLLQDYAGKDWTEPSGLDCRGTGPLYRAYECADGWIFIAAQDCGIAGCPALADLACLAGKAGSELEQALTQRFRTRSADDWVALLMPSGIAAQREVLKLDRLLDDPLVRAQGLALTREHEGLGRVTTTGPGIRLSRTPVQPGRPAPRPGADAADILAEVGLAHRLDEWIREGVVVTEGIQAGGAS